MEDNLQRIFAILLTVVVFFLMPIYLAFDKKDDVAYALALRITSNFVDNVTTKGYLTAKMYNDFVSELSTTDNLYEIHIEHVAKKYYPVIYSYTDNTYSQIREKFDYEIYKDGLEKNSITFDDGTEYTNLVLSYEYSEEKFTENQIFDVLGRTNYTVFSKLSEEEYKLNYVNGTYKLPYITNMYGISATDDSLEDGNNYNSMYTMSVGDEFNIIIKNINVTVGTVLFNTITMGANTGNDTRVYINYGGTIENEEYKEQTDIILSDFNVSDNIPATMGDVNHDGAILDEDAYLIVDYIFNSVADETLRADIEEYGDMDSDGKITVNDLKIMYEQITGNEYTEKAGADKDINGDGLVNETDANIINKDKSKKSYTSVPVLQVIRCDVNKNGTFDSDDLAFF